MAEVGKMEFEFDDALSEDWVSQPRSSAVPSVKDDSSLLIHKTGSTSLSRLPRPKTQPSLSGIQSSSRSSILAGDAALYEKRGSDLNLLKTRRSNGSTKSLGRPVASRPASYNGLSQSFSSNPHGTVQHKNAKSSKECESTGSTPEWKRRVLHGKTTVHGQQDLFSPMGLEKVFKPPKSGAQLPSPQRKIKSTVSDRHQLSQVMPSSPPPYPAFMNKSKIDRASYMNHEGSSAVIPPLTAVKEQSASVTIASSMDCLRSPGGRVRSGQTETRNEIISPIQISNTHIDINSVRQSVRKLQQKMDLLGIEEQPRPCSRSSDNGLRLHGESQLAESFFGAENTDLADCTSVSLPQNTSLALKSMAAKGAFVTTRRGGRSPDSSFLMRPLSPSSFPMPSLPAAPSPPVRSDTPGVADTEFSDPETPERLSKPSLLSPGLPKSSGSPLKLFDKYDTFTNDRLCRRLSQFEDRPGHDGTETTSDDGFAPSSPSPTKTTQNLRKQGRDKNHACRRISNFGVGELDAYGFDHPDSSHLEKSFNPNDEDQENMPPLPALDRVTHANLNSYAIAQDISERERKGKSKMSHHQRVPTEVLSQTRETFEKLDIRVLDGKRALNSPEKTPGPKRMRLSHESPKLTKMSTSIRNEVRSSSAHSVAGKKRKDARYEKSDSRAAPEILASRRFLHPKVAGVHSQGQSVRLVDTPTEILAGELASFAQDITEGMTHGNRKKSVTTADFFMEANLIMQNIRAQAHPQSGRVSTQGSDYEQLPSVLESFREEFTLEEFSRPASREGNRLRKPRQPIELDARVVSHLRKFEENDDLGLILSSSLKPIHITEEDRSFVSQVSESDPPNIRIRDGPNIANRQVGNDSAPFSIYDDESAETRLSNPTSSNPSGRTVPTGSSAGSAPRAVIGPEKVSHLISGNMGGMTFDPQKQCWVKRKTSMPGVNSSKDGVDSDGMEDDPFQEIPDLTVDESEELRNVQASAVKSRPSTMESDQTEHTGSTRILSKDSVQSGSVRAASQYDMESSAMSKNSRLASSGPTIETRATSWGEPPLRINDLGPKLSESTLDCVVEGRLQDRRPHIYQINEIPNKGARKYQARAVTVAFSSPLVDAVQEPPSGDIWDEESAIDLGDGRESSGLGHDKLASKSTSSFRTASTYKSNPRQRSARQISIGNRIYESRPISRIDEQDELSFLESGKALNSNMELALSTPQPLQDMPGTLSMPPTGNRNSTLGFHLSPLPDFTVNQVDESFHLDVHYVAKRRGLLSVQDVEDNFSLAIKDLVKQITDVEPYEPYWEYIRKLNLQKRGLLTIHMLDEFCSRVEELDVSDNDLGQLNGAPESLRNLSVRNNCLSNLTAWNHLKNLQYLDVSGNNIKSLKGLQCLFHIREINAENNKIDTLEGIVALDGLLKLNLSHNSLEHVNFHGSELQRLTSLEIHSNHIHTVHGLQHLCALETVDLRNNKLKTFEFDELNLPRSVKSVDLSTNCLTELDISCAPRLSYLNLDANHIKVVEGIDRQEAVEYFSWRDQNIKNATGSMEHIHYQSCHQAQFLCLSGNRLPGFSPNSFFFSLRRLEIASCGLETLSDNFGLHLPNLRALNLNHNALRDIRPLLGITCLDELHIAGNRISRLRRTMTVLGRIGHAMEILDCRDNPITLGFYSPHKVQASGEQGMVQRGRDAPAQRDRVDRDELSGQSYLLPLGDEQADGRHLESLDEDTLCRRDVYEVMVLQGCRNLLQWDGMPTPNRMAANREETFRRLVELGVLRPKPDTAEREALPAAH